MLCLLSSIGCRSLSYKRREIPLVSARQLSLKGVDALDRDRTADAETLFLEALQSCPADERAHWGLAEILWTRGETASAIAHIQEAVRLSGGNPDYRLRLGQMYLDLGDSIRARTQAEAILDQDYSHAKAWALKGDCQRYERRWSEALEAYNRALLSKPDFPDVQISLADIHCQMCRPERALATLDRITDAHPTEESNSRLMLIRGLALADLERKEEAIAALNRAGESLPSGQNRQQLRVATAQYRLGELVGARMTVGRILQHDPFDSDAQKLQSELDLSFRNLVEPPYR